MMELLSEHSIPSSIAEGNDQTVVLSLAAIGTSIFAGLENGSIFHLSTTSDECKVVAAHKGPIWALVCMSREDGDDDWLVSAGNDAVVKVWNISSGQVIPLTALSSIPNANN